MCQEVFKIVQNMELSNVEAKLALHCAPLITGIKISNLLIVAQSDEVLVRDILKESGIMYYRLLRMEEKTTFLLFHRSKLTAYLQDTDVLRVLQADGYTEFSLAGILCHFQERFQAHMLDKVGFPHEMGLLLGYPVEDVEGFIRYKGQKALCSGYWKVYRDVSAKKQIFDDYENAKEILICLLYSGQSMRAIMECYRGQVIV